MKYQIKQKIIIKIKFMTIKLVLMDLENGRMVIRAILNLMISNKHINNRSYTGKLKFT